jgi:hypothetical protein
MKRPTNKEIKEAIEKLKERPAGSHATNSLQTPSGKPASKKSSMRIRKQGI